MDPEERVQDRPAQDNSALTASSNAQILFGVFLVASFLGAVTLSRVLDPVPPPPAEEAPPPQVAVMPLYNLALEPGDHYLSYALADELTQALGQNRALGAKLRHHVHADVIDLYFQHVSVPGHLGQHSKRDGRGQIRQGRGSRSETAQVCPLITGK